LRANLKSLSHSLSLALSDTHTHTTQIFGTNETYPGAYTTVAVTDWVSDSSLRAQVIYVSKKSRCVQEVCPRRVGVSRNSAVTYHP